MASYDGTMAIPGDGVVGTWAGRAWVPASLAADGRGGPHVIGVQNGRVYDLSGSYPTFSELINSDAPAARVQANLLSAPTLCPLAHLLANSIFFRREKLLNDEKNCVLLAPNDLSATKACGVTFIKSLLERVVEEKAQGDMQAASTIREIILDTLGNDLSKVRPGSPQAVELKRRLVEEGIWSQYPEVGIGPDAEIFTKASPMASVGYGAEIGVLPSSSWSNPEPEIVLVISRHAEIVGATLGNDVNLRDYEGRSALLLGKAKDQNGSCSIGPLVRLFDDTFSLKDVEMCELTLTIVGRDGFTVQGQNRMCEISRSPRELVAQAMGRHHQYPDGLVLFMETMFAPTDDRDAPGEGFIHHRGDRVEIATPCLGTLVNWVDSTDNIPRWEYGIGDLLRFLAAGSHYAPSA